MLAFECKTGLAMIKYFLIKQCYAGIAAQMLFMAGYTSRNGILKVIPMLHVDCCFNFTMALKTFSPGYFFTMFMTEVAV